MRDWAIEQIYNIGTQGVEQEAWFQRLTTEQRQAAYAQAGVRAAEYADKLLAAIETKDIKCLRVAIHNGNKASKAIFTRATGIALGKTEKENREIIRQYVGAEAWDAYYAAQDAARKAADEKWRAQQEAREREAVLGASVRYTPDGEKLARVCTIREFIDDLIQRGYNVLTPVKRGRCTDYHLHKGTRRYTFRKKIEVKYIQERLNSI